MSFLRFPRRLRAVAAGLVMAQIVAVAALAAPLEPRDTETAALPSLGPVRAEGLPRVLSPADAKRYRAIFDLQEAGQWSAADRLIAGLDDRRLMGHVLFQRYMHPTAYRSSFPELKAWMARYADHPGAERIYRLAMRRKPADAEAPHPPEAASKRLGYAGREPYVYRSPRRRTPNERRAVETLLRQARLNVLDNRLTITEGLLSSERAEKLLDPVEIDSARAQVAAGWFYYGDPQNAFRLADAAARRSGAHVPLAHWIGGLAAWHLGRFEAAARHFQALALSERARDWRRAAGGYWAARAALKRGRPAEASDWLRLAAQYRYTFYGLLTRQALGVAETPARPSAEAVRGLAALLQRPKAGRAAALLQVGQADLAEAELAGLSGTLDRAGLAALASLAERGRLAGLSMRLASRLGTLEGAAADLVAAGLFPLPPWQPETGFKVDRALIFALIRQESKFDPTARSGDGARGLMQLMPATASFVAGDSSLKRGNRSRLDDPALNLELGQRYILHLMGLNEVGDDLLRLAVAYNGGPGNLRKWLRRIAEHSELDDPLLFIEGLPSRETRLFIRRVLTNFWMYRQRLGQPAPSLAALAAGQWPRYRPLD